jgi:nucleoside 2-deoxyribosyltransferase
VVVTVNRTYYFAARYSRHAELRAYRDQLLEAFPDAGVTSGWIDPRPGDEEDCAPDMLDTEPARCWQFADIDLADIDAADIFVSFTGPVGRGGRHIEHGYAMARGLRIVIVGPRDNIFHCAPDTEVYPSWPEFLAAEVRTGGAR